MRISLLLLLGLVASASLGCSISSINNEMKWNRFRENVFNKSRHAEFDKELDPETIPASMAVIWHEATATQQGTTPTRGFGGRIFFYNSSNKPIPVEGELVVYAFDDSDDEGKKTAPDKKFVINADEFKNHQGDSELGTCYNIWVPWDEAGGYRKAVSLLPVFKPANGQMVKGCHSVNILPGKIDPEKQKLHDIAESVKGLHLAYTGTDSPRNLSRLRDDADMVASNQVQYRSDQTTTTIPISRDSQLRFDAMRKEAAAREAAQKSQLEQLQQIAAQTPYGGELETRVVYGKLDLRQLRNSPQQTGENSQQSFSPPADMINGNYGAAYGSEKQMQNPDQGEYGANRIATDANQNAGQMQPASATFSAQAEPLKANSTQSNARQSDSRPVFGRPGSYR
jgi:hypothetical protein